MKSYLEGRAAVAREGVLTAPSAPVRNSVLPAFAQPPNDKESVSDARETPEPSPARKHSEVKVETIEEGGVVRAIVVTCTCGERIEVHCGY
jgi:hypothetical protein